MNGSTNSATDLDLRKYLLWLFQSIAMGTKRKADVAVETDREYAR